MKIKHRQEAENEALRKELELIRTRLARVERRAGIAIRALERLEVWPQLPEEARELAKDALLAQHR
jgi:hypothetical protein